ncbi:MAG: hypothetical protein GX936_08460 [Clostridiales bacterium]|nr:hypothetical protein [Clostridiales bacterium]
MLQFTNGFSCAVDDKKTEIVIRFEQTCPGFDESGKVSSLVNEPVTTLIMHKDVASGLISALTRLLSDPDQGTNEGVAP